MADVTPNTAKLHHWIDCLRSGDRAAIDEMLNSISGRLHRMAQRMLKGFPNVRRWEDASDVQQRASLRLLRSLQSVRPASSRDFFNFAAVQIRRELMDLARHYHGAESAETKQASIVAGSPRDPLADRPDPKDATELDRWTAFHSAVEQLPTAEREVIGLAFYHGWTHAQIADLLQVSERTIRRYWAAACAKLNASLDGQLPNACESDSGGD